MADMQEQLNAILGDPEAMAQITRLAQSLTGGQTASPDGSGEAPPPVGEEVGRTPPPDLSALLGSVDPRLIQLGMRLYGEYTAPDDQRAALLAALTPFVKEERRETLEKAQRAARLAHVIRSAMKLLGEEGEGHV